MGTYIIQGSDGRFYGPADEAAIDAWAAEGRILADTLVIEQGTNRQMRARDLPRLQHHFKFTPPAGTVQSTQQPYAPLPHFPGQRPFIPDPLQLVAPTGYARKRRTTAALLAVFLGFVGAHRFYLGYKSTAMWMIVICIAGWYLCRLGPVVTLAWAALDLVSILTRQMQDVNGYALD